MPGVLINKERGMWKDEEREKRRHLGIGKNSLRDTTASEARPFTYVSETLLSHISPFPTFLKSEITSTTTSLPPRLLADYLRVNNLGEI